MKQVFHPRVSVLLQAVLFLLWMLGAEAGCRRARAEEIVLTEDRLKALWVYNLAKFVDWPAAALTAQNQPFVIGVIGRPTLANELLEMTRNETIKNRPIRIWAGSQKDDLSQCHIVFVGESETDALRSLNSVAREKYILTVGESASFAADGGMIELRLAGKQIRCVVNLKSLGAASLVPRAKLLSLKQVEQVKEH